MTRGKVNGLMRSAAMVLSAGLLCSAAWAANPPAKRARPERGADARRDGPRRQARPGAGVSIRTGQDAPDVALYPLTMTTDANGVEVATVGKTKVKLSAYKGKAPIVIFSSSYT